MLLSYGAVVKRFVSFLIQIFYGRLDRKKKKEKGNTPSGVATPMEGYLDILEIDLDKPYVRFN